MITNKYNQQMSCNRILDRNLRTFLHVQIQDDQVYMSVVLAALQMCDQCGLRKETKYICRKLFDIYILMFPFSTPEELQFAGINFIRLSAKYNQDPSCYNLITIDYCMQSAGYAYTRQQFIDFELNVFNRDQFSMNFTTPYDYLGSFSSIFTIGPELFNKINFILDFTLTIKDLMFSSAQEIFFGAMLFFFSQSDSAKFLISSQSFSYQESLNTSIIINQNYQIQFQEPQNTQFQ